MTPEGCRLVFSATFACARCRLRFARRTKCPSCGGVEVFPLTAREGRARYRAAARTKLGAGQGILVRLAPWAPQRTVIPAFAALLMMAPAPLGFAIWGARLFQKLWLMDDLSTKYEGLSAGGFSMLAIAFAGAVLLVFTVLAKAGKARGERARPSPATRMRVFAPADGPRGETSLTGIARRASVEIVSGVSGEPCLLFGVRGEVGTADVADAEGGDFDLELPSGERVMISLEHAMLAADASEHRAEAPEEIGGALAELLENRAIPEVERGVVLDEHLVRDGDTVTVTGNLLGGTVTSLGYRGASGARVLAGDDERPLLVQVSPPGSRGGENQSLRSIQ